MASDTGSDGPVDSFDAILKQVVRVPAVGAPAPELAPGTELAGRFAIERVIGVGGMGAVYAADDRSLGRTVAIKLLHVAGGGLRLRREAVAMARLAHPNVVTVFEVGEHEHRPFVVMEYVPGTTLRAWLGAATRSPREILDALVATGEGLAAAHQAGLVHRDIKPDNVLIGDDGRTRVGDFGLARDLDAGDDAVPGGSAADRLLAPMTRTGAVLGTPAYMAPEQVTGGAVDARTDQFAFCVTAWEALWSERPFAGETIEELERALTEDRPRPPPATPKVAARVHAALARGLARDPDARFPTMTALLAELRPPIARRRRRFVALAGIAAIATGALGYAALTRPAAVDCEIASPVLANASTALARLADHYTTARTAACRAKADWSPELAAKSEACFDVALRVIERADRPKAHGLIARTHHEIDACQDPAYLAASPALPSSPDQLDAVIAAHADLRIAFAELDAAHRASTAATVARLSASAAASDPEIAAGILVLRARGLAFDGKIDESNKLYTDAYYAARALDDAEDSLAALVGLISNATDLRVDHETADRWMRAGLADAERLRKRSPWFAARMHLTAAQLADQDEDAPRALAALAKAHALFTDDDGDWRIEAFAIEGAVHVWSGKIDTGIAAFEKAVALARQIDLDPEQTAVILGDYAASLLGAGRDDQARAVGERAMALVATVPDSAATQNVRANFAVTLIGTEREAEARVLLERVRAYQVARFGERNTTVSNIDSNLAVIDAHRGDHAGALARLQRVLAIDEVQLGPDDLALANRLYAIASELAALDRPAEGIVAARRALAIYTAKSPESIARSSAELRVAHLETATGDAKAGLARATGVLASTSAPGEPDHEQLLAWASLERGRALIALGRKPEARTELAAARPVFTAQRLAARITELDVLDRAAR